MSGGSPDAGLAEIDASLRRCRRAMVWGAGIGAATGALLALWSPGDDGPTSPGGIARLVVVVAALGASIGLVAVMFPLARAVAEVLGDRYTAQPRLERIVAGKVRPRDEDEQRRASLWAALAPRLLPMRYAHLPVLTALVVPQLLGGGRGGLDTVGPWISILALVFLAMAAALMIRQLRHCRTYLAAHPIDTDG